MKPNYRAINETVRRARNDADAARISEVARHAADLQRQTGCTRTEALRIAERAIPHPKHI